MYMALSLILFMELLAYFPLVISFQDVYASTEEGNWVEARSLCKETNGTNDVLSGCQPENCRPYSLISTIKAMERDTIYWLRGYVLRSRIMEYTGCYQIPEDFFTKREVNNFTFEDNPLIQCSTFCNDNKDGDVMLFTSTTCYCIKSTFYSWWETFVFRKISSDECNFKCPGDEYNRCGSENNTTVVSCYTFKPLYPDPIFNTVGQFCFFVDELKQINYTECNRLLKFNCQKLEISNKKIKWDSKCYPYGLNWYDARKTCAQDRFLQIYTDNQCADYNIKQGDATWHNRFVTAKIIWNKGDPSDDNCLGLLVTKQNEYKLETRDCNEKHKTLCRNGSHITKDTTELETMHIPSTVVWYIMSPLLFLLVAVVLVIPLWRYINVQRQNSTLQTNAMEEEVPYDEIDQSKMDVISPGSETHSVVNTNDERIDVVTSGNDTSYSLSTDEEGYLNPYQPLKEDWRLSNIVYESPIRPPDYENSASLVAESENENICHEYGILQKAQPDDHVYE